MWSIKRYDCLFQNCTLSHQKKTGYKRQTYTPNKCLLVTASQPLSSSLTPGLLGTALQAKPRGTGPTTCHWGWDTRGLPILNSVYTTYESPEAKSTLASISTMSSSSKKELPQLLKVLATQWAPPPQGPKSRGTTRPTPTPGPDSPPRTPAPRRQQAHFCMAKFPAEDTVLPSCAYSEVGAMPGF